ncbi:MAG TPA: hypothetical protein VIB48_19695 [Acidimicrobiia bacterium]|jgi:hypothetical protein
MTRARAPTQPPADDGAFWRLATSMLDQPGVTKSTMMGLLCLRYEGDFFACCDRNTGDLVVKLNAPCVAALIAAGRAEPFAPAGRPFREWVAIPLDARRTWRRYIEEALRLAHGRRVG